MVSLFNIWKILTTRIPSKVATISVLYLLWHLFIWKLLSHHPKSYHDFSPRAVSLTSVYLKSCESFMHGTFKYLHKYLGYQPEVTFFLCGLKPGLSSRIEKNILHKSQPWFSLNPPHYKERNVKKLTRWKVLFVAIPICQITDGYTH